MPAAMRRSVDVPLPIRPSTPTTHPSAAVAEEASLTAAVRSEHRYGDGGCHKNKGCAKAETRRPSAGDGKKHVRCEPDRPHLSHVRVPGAGKALIVQHPQVSSAK